MAILTLAIRTETAAFEHKPQFEIANILRHLADSIEVEPDDMRSYREASQLLFDRWGDKCGAVSLIDFGK